MSTEDRVASYLTSLSTLEPEPSQLAALRTATPRPRRRRPRNVAALVLVILAGSSTLATATGLVSLPGSNPDPVPPARVAEQPLPADARGLLSVFGTPGLTGDRAASALSAVTRALRGPYVVAPGSIRPLGTTPSGAPAYVAYARVEPGQRDRFAEGVVAVVDGTGTEGPYPARDIQRGVAWGIHETDDGALLTTIVPDGVAAIQVTMDDGTRAAAPVRGNVAFAPLATGAGTGLDELRWLDAQGRPIAK